MSQLEAGSATGQILFVRDGQYAGPITLQPGQRLLGDGIVHVIVARQGTFALPALPAGRYIVEFSKDGYEIVDRDFIMADTDVRMMMDLYPTPPRDSSGNSATARCKDGSWSWAAREADACVANRGIAYLVCPGPLCNEP